MAVPDTTGNRRLDAFRNVVQTGRAEMPTHCPKAFVRSGLWDLGTWPARDEQPSPAAMLREHVGRDALTLEDADQAMVDAVTISLAWAPLAAPRGGRVQ